MLGFLIGALLGSVLLMLPVSLKKGVTLGYIDSLFVAVSAICVTGLSTVNIGQTFSGFGQAVLLFTIQIGGLGIVTFTTLVLLAFGRRITLADRKLIQSAYNLDTFTGLVSLTLRIVRVTLILELIGAVGYAFVFIPQFGAKGIWYSVFHAVSCFCNAGIDILGGNSFCTYRDNVIINIVTMFLIVVSGLGFPVYWELIRILRESGGAAAERRKLGFHARLVLLATAVLIISGALLTLVFEYDNPATLGSLSFGKKVMASFFQSITLRTAGFATIDQSLFRESSCLVYLFFMFIGGSPAGTAGGVKTITVVLLLALMWANIFGKKQVELLGRRVADEYVKRAVAIVAFSFSMLLLLTVAVLYVQPYDFLDVMYEMTSAIATVGLSRGMTGSLLPASKLIICAAMYLGRIGPITLALAFNVSSPAAAVIRAEGKVIVG